MNQPVIHETATINLPVSIRVHHPELQRQLFTPLGSWTADQARWPCDNDLSGAMHGAACGYTYRYVVR